MARKDYYYDSNAPKANSLVVAASAVVTDSEAQILLHKRSDNNLWSLLGGGMDIGETLHQAVIREVKEESGFNVKVNRLIGIYSDPNHVIAYSNGEVRQQFSICFHCEIIGGKQEVSDESTELRFFNPAEILNFTLHPAQKARIEDFLANEVLPFIR